jgi:nitrate reductase NapE component
MQSKYIYNLRNVISSHSEGSVYATLKSKLGENEKSPSFFVIYFIIWKMLSLSIQGGQFMIPWSLN